jgi:inorganic pyrophosphatase
MSGTQDTFFQANVAPIFIIGSAIFSIFWGTVNALLVKNVDMSDRSHIIKLFEDSPEECVKEKEGDDLMSAEASADEIMKVMDFIGEKVTNGAIQFLAQEYLYLGIFSGLFAVILGLTVDWQEMSRAEAPTNFPFTAVAFLVGSGTSILAGYLGMRIAVFTNTRTTYMCCEDIGKGFLVAFRGGQVLGFCLVGLALLVLEILLLIFRAAWYSDALVDVTGKDGMTDEAKTAAAMELTRRLFELIAGYGLGGSSVALFGRVGGGIYTKAADVGADLVGKTLIDLPEDDPSNAGTIADNVGDNVGDIAGMGADLFGSLAESTCAALVVSATSKELVSTPDALYFPLMITASGIVASFVSVLLVHTRTVTSDNVQSVLKWQIGYSTILMTATVIPALYALPEEFTFDTATGQIAVTRWTAFGCIMFGLWSGMAIGFITEYYTSNDHTPVLELVESTKNGPAPNIILGLALGYMSVVIPIICITATIGYAFATAGMYGVGLAALGMLGSLPVALSIDGYGPISDNAGGIAEMTGLPGEVRARTDALDAAGNTTAAIGKGFAIGSACLVGLALFGAFITRVEGKVVDILQPVQFGGLLMGAMLPYAFSAFTMKAVGEAALEMMDFIIADYNAGQKKIEEGGKYDPDYDGCIAISTNASLRMMVAPGVLVLGSPLLAGFLFGPNAVAGLLAGSITSGVQVAISASNTGGAWDNCKKEVEKRRQIQLSEVKAALKDSDHANIDEAIENEGDDDQKQKWIAMREASAVLKEKKVAAVVGDTVGDPLKDTSGPAINILIKLGAITSLVFGSYIKDHHAFNVKGA